MEDSALMEKLQKLIKVGETNGRRWAIVRFKDLWDAGLASEGKDKLEFSLLLLLKGVGIDLEFDPENEYLPGYVTLISASGCTVYVGRDKLTDWSDAKMLFDAVKEVLDNN